MTPCGVWTAIGVGVRDAVGDGDELDVEGADAPTLTVGDRDHLGLPEQPGLLDAVAGQPERQRRAVDREADLAEQELQPADVVLVPVRGDDGVDAVGVLAEVREVGQDEVDAVEVGPGEHEPAVDEQDATVGTDALLDRHAVAADLAQAAQEDDPHRVRHLRGLPATEASTRFPHPRGDQSA